MPRAYIDTVQVIETTTESIGGGVFRFAKANGDTAVAYCRSCCRVANVVAAASAAVAIAVQYLKEIQTCVLSYIRHLQANCKHRVCWIPTDSLIQKIRQLFEMYLEISFYDKGSQFQSFSYWKKDGFISTFECSK